MNLVLKEILFFGLFSILWVRPFLKLIVDKFGLFYGPDNPEINSCIHRMNYVLIIQYISISFASIIMRHCYVQSEFIYKIYKYVICEICIIEQYLGLINYKLI